MNNKEARIYNGEGIASLMNDIEKTGQPHAKKKKKSNWTTFSHYMQN